MKKFGCDYEYRTIGESIAKYPITDDWCAEFNANDGACPIVCIQVAQIRKLPNLMALKIRAVKNSDEEYAGCIMRRLQKTVVFKVDDMSDLIKAMKISVE